VAEAIKIAMAIASLFVMAQILLELNALDNHNNEIKIAVQFLKGSVD